MQKVTKKKPAVTGSSFTAPTTGSYRNTRTKTAVPIMSRPVANRGYLDQAIAANNSKGSGAGMKMRIEPNVRRVSKKKGGGGR